MTLALKVGTTVKPKCAALSPQGDLPYLGRMDNRYVDFGNRREQVTNHALRDALLAVLAGKPIASPSVKGIGCDIDVPRKK